MKVKNKQIFLILFLFGILGLLIYSLFLSNGKLVFSTGNVFKQEISYNDPADISLSDFDGYYNDEQKYVDVEHYNLKFDLLTDEEILKGDVTITGRLLEPKDSMHLNFYDDFNIEEITLNGQDVKYINSGTSLLIYRNSPIDEFEIQIKYEGQPVELGFGSFVFGEFNGRSVVYSLSEPNYASTWFPCNDLPTDKSLADIYITNDSSKVSVSNGYLADVSNSGSRRTYHWKTVYPISTYLISISSADYKSFHQEYKSISGENLNLVFYSFPEDNDKAKTDMEDHPDYMKFMENTFGEYPFIKEKYGVAEFLWANGAMEHQTITGFSYRYYSGRKYYSGVLVHELAHQWWGNAVGPASWRDVWLNESFAKYSEALYWEYKEGTRAYHSTMEMIFGDFDDGTLYNPGNNLFGRKVYNKGAWVLHMLRHELGDEIFFKILKTYFKVYKYKNASTEDFKGICEKVSGMDLDYFFNQWLYEGIGIISLRYNWKYDNDKIHLKLKQVQTGFENYHFPMDILLENSQKDELKKVFIASRDTTILINSSFIPSKLELDPGGWLLAHPWEEKE